IELSAEQAFWSQYSVQTDEPNLSATTTIVEVLKELPKLSMVNSCLKKLKSHLASFDMVVKERTTVTAITEGTWGFEHTKACFRDDIIPFVKALKELFTSFDQYLIDEVTKVQNVFKQMDLAVEQHREEKQKFQNKIEHVLQENDRLLTQALSVEIMSIVVHDNVMSECLNVDVCAHCVTIESELKKDFIKKECYETEVNTRILENLEGTSLEPVVTTDLRKNEGVSLNEDEGDDDDDQEEGNDDDQNSDEEGEEFIHPKLSIYDEEETKDEESFDPIPKTPKNTNDEGNDEKNICLKVGMEEGQDEEDDEDELYGDVILNMEGRVV
nr:hypothetical protein [Tanacetum cinerariifolium]